MVKIISGGQSGVDRAGLVAAQKCNLETGGTMPKGFKTEDGDKPEYSTMYGMVQNSSTEYEVRTKDNVLKSHVTLVFYCGKKGKGTELTIKTCEKERKPYFVYDIDVPLEKFPALVAKILDDLRNCVFIKHVPSPVINIAGTRGSKLPPRAEENLVEILVAVFTAFKTSRTA